MSNEKLRVLCKFSSSKDKFILDVLKSSSDHKTIAKSSFITKVEIVLSNTGIKNEDIDAIAFKIKEDSSTFTERFTIRKDLHPNLFTVYSKVTLKQKILTNIIKRAADLIENQPDMFEAFLTNYMLGTSTYQINPKLEDINADDILAMVNRDYEDRGNLPLPEVIEYEEILGKTVEKEIESLEEEDDEDMSDVAFMLDDNVINDGTIRNDNDGGL